MLWYTKITSYSDELNIRCSCWLYIIRYTSNSKCSALIEFTYFSMHIIIRNHPSLFPYETQSFSSAVWSGFPTNFPNIYAYTHLHCIILLTYIHVISIALSFEKSLIRKYIWIYRDTCWVNISILSSRVANTQTPESRFAD